MDNVINEAKTKMIKAIEALESKFTNVRAGRANPAMLNGIMAEYYGVPTPIQNIANITVPEARQLFVKPFDKSSLKNIEKAISEANLGITPTNNGEMIIITIPELNEERRKEYVKLVKTIAEETRVALRNAREEARNTVKRAELPEDETDMYYEEIQDLIDEYNKLVEEKTKIKEQELMSF